MRNKRFPALPAAVIVLAVLVWGTLGGCGRTGDNEVKNNDSQAQLSDSQIKVIVSKYNETLPLAYAGETEILSSVATEREVRRVELFKAQLAEEDMTIRANPVSLEVKEIRRGPSGSISVYTVEIWEFRHLESNTLKPLDEWKRIRYQAVYHLTKSDQGWLVDGIDFEEKLLN